MIAVLGAATVARAEEAAPRKRSRALALTAAIVPGVIVHGAGHWVAGDRPMAKRMLYVQLAAAAVAAIGGLPIAVTGASEESMPGLVLLVPAGGVLIAGWAADIYGAAGGARLGGRPEREPADVEVELGYRFVGDPQLPWANLATLGAEGRLDRARLGGSAWLGDEVWRIGGEAAARLIGGRSGRPAADGTRLELVVRAAEQRFDPMVAVATYELAATGRLDLGRLGASLEGSYASLELGGAVEHTRYRVDGVDGVLSSRMLGRFAWGMYLGDGDGRGRRGEIELFYDHRRDQLAGGVVIPRSLNGFIGHVGIDAVGYQGPWGITAGVDVGSAWVLRLGLRRRFEVLP